MEVDCDVKKCCQFALETIKDRADSSRERTGDSSKGTSLSHIGRASGPLDRRATALWHSGILCCIIHLQAVITNSDSFPPPDLCYIGLDISICLLFKAY